MIRSTKSMIYYVLAILLPLILLTSCATSARVTDATAGPALIEPEATRIDTARVTRGPVGNVEILVGVTRYNTVAVRAEITSGRIGSIYVFPGEAVTEGQLVARLDITHIETQIERYEENLSRARQMHSFENRGLALDVEGSILAYMDALRRAAQIPDPALAAEADRQRSNIDMAELAQAQALDRQAREISAINTRLRELSDELTDMEIRAHRSGVVTYLMVSPGAWVSLRDPIIYITYNDAVFVEYVGQTLTLQEARLRTRVLGNIGDDVFYLELVEPSLEEQMYYNRRNLAPPVRFEVIGNVMPDVGANVSIYASTQWIEDTLRIPRNALNLRGPYGSYVYRIENGIPVHVVVDAGIPTDTYVAIIDGLEEGDEVVVRP